MTKPLLTLSEVKDYINVNSTISEYDARLKTLISTATTQLEQYTQRQFEKKERAEFYRTVRNTSNVINLFGDGNSTSQQIRRQRVNLRALPVDTGQDITVWFDAKRKYTEDTKLKEDEFFVDDEYGVLYVEKPLVDTVRGLKITYTAGYEASGSPETLSASAPEDLKLACLTQVLYLFDKLQSGSISTSSQVGDEGEPYNDPGTVLCRESINLVRRFRPLNMAG